jgi:3-oxosteroid 1-dehydrogenase
MSMRAQLPANADFVIVGSGIGGLVAAYVARLMGAKPVVIEQEEFIGGSSALSGGLLWIPANPLMLAAGVDDSIKNGRTYLDALVGDVGPSTSAARKDAYLESGPPLIALLIEHGIRLRYAKHYPDYYDDLPGGSESGRAIEPLVFNLNKLGPRAAALRPKIRYKGIALFSSELAPVATSFRRPRGMKRVVRIATRTVSRRIRGQLPTTNGQSLVAQLLLLLDDVGVPVLTRTPLVRLEREGNRVTGVLVENDERSQVRIGAHKGVLLASGGFARNKEMRSHFGQQPSSTDWTIANPGDRGGGIAAAMAIGAAVDLMDEAWWQPTVMLPGGTPLILAFERAVPHSIIVDSTGQRYTNEAASYMEVGREMYRRHLDVPAVPSWMIFDSYHRRHYMFGMTKPGKMPEDWVKSGFVIRSDTLSELAAAIGADSTELDATVQRFNSMARRGVDLDFRRGARAFDSHFGDSYHKPNPSLGPVDSPPYYAVAVYPGDVGTAGGIVTDEHARVIDTTGAVIEGMYATGNCTASVFGRTYPGAGASIGASAVFGSIAARHALSSGEQ